MSSPFRQVRTPRLLLDAVTDADLEPMYTLHSDPDVWRHLPTARHLNRERTTTFIAGMQPAWTRDGLGYWVARRKTDGSFVGIGGCARRLDVVWNVYYRLVPSAWGYGYASEIVAAARTAAAAVEPGRPVVAYLVEHNEASRRTAERAGLTLAWSGPDHGNPDPKVIRLIYSDRALSDEVIETLTSHS